MKLGLISGVGWILVGILFLPVPIVGVPIILAGLFLTLVD